MASLFPQFRLNEKAPPTETVVKELHDFPGRGTFIKTYCMVNDSMHG